MVEKELDIKLDITKKSRRINRPVQFADQHGETEGGRLVDVVNINYKDTKKILEVMEYFCCLTRLTVYINTYT